MKFTKIASVLFASVILATSCSKSVEDLNKDWESNKAKVTKLQSEYPTLKAYLEEDLTKGQAQFDKVASAKDEDAQKDLLEMANKALNKCMSSKINKLVEVNKSF